MKIHLPEVLSTNSWVLQQLSEQQPLQDGTVVWTDSQTAGRGQVGNVWESAPGLDLTFSILLKPTFLAPRNQFVISEMAALAVRKVVQGEMPDKKVLVKWPNDVYVGDEKICGMLIENQLQGMNLAYSVIGIGLNVNQEKWVGNAPNPTSIKLQCGKELALEPLLDSVVGHILSDYEALCAYPDLVQNRIHADFVRNLYRGEGYHPYVDAKTGEAFQAKIEGVEAMGPLCLLDQDGHQRVYGFKEVKFVLPCGVTKE